MHILLPTGPKQPEVIARLLLMWLISMKFILGILNTLLLMIRLLLDKLLSPNIWILTYWGALSYRIVCMSCLRLEGGWSLCSYINPCVSAFVRSFWAFLKWIGIPFQNQLVHIQFWFFNRLYEVNHAEFDCRIHLPYDGISIIGHESFNVQEFWCEITRDKRILVVDNHESRVAYNTSGSKATSICNPTLRYLHRFIINTIFTRHESQSRARVSEVFLLWFILQDQSFATRAFLLHLLA